jgi:hypothetical protein
MKITDYCPRAAPFDSYLKGRGLIGVEVGVDVGAHAEALLTYCPVRLLHLVDPWENLERRGYCDGRLSRFRGRYDMHRGPSIGWSEVFAKDGAQFDFAYIDQIHEGPSVAADLAAWWPLLKPGGVLGYRNYTRSGTPLDKSVDAFVSQRSIKAHVESGEIILVKQ